MSHDMHHVASIPGSKGSATHATMQRLPHTSAVFPPDQQEYKSYLAAALKKCSIICGCDIRTQAQLQMFQKWMRGPNGATAQDRYASKMRVSQSLPFLLPSFWTLLQATSWLLHKMYCCFVESKCAASFNLLAERMSHMQLLTSDCRLCRKGFLWPLAVDF